MKMHSTPTVHVIGGGLTGNTAALTAFRSGAKVVLIDKLKMGGNSAKATSGVNAVNTKYQKAIPEIHDSIELFTKDTLKSGHGLCVESLVQALVAGSGKAVDELSDIYGLHLPDVNQLGGHSARRTHKFPAAEGKVAPVGFIMAQSLGAKYKELVTEGKAELREGTALVDFEITRLADGTPVISSMTLEKDNMREVITNPTAVVFATGGYAADASTDSIIGKTRPDLIGFPTTNGPFAVGDTIVIGEKRGLATLHLDQVQLHPTGFVHRGDPMTKTKFLCPEVIRSLGGLLVDTKGRRFVNELLPRDAVSAAILKHGSNSLEWEMQKFPDDSQRIALMIMTERTAERFGTPAFNFYVDKGFIFELNGVESIAKQLPTVDLTELRKAMSDHDSAARGEKADAFGKTTFPELMGDITSKKVYGAFIVPSLHYTMGGLKVGSDSRAILSATGETVANLFVAGENAGGVHGGNRLGGNGCLESLVFGRLAGLHATDIPSDIHTAPRPAFNSAAAGPGPHKLTLREVRLADDKFEVIVVINGPSLVHVWDENNQITSLILQSWATKEEYVIHGSAIQFVKSVLGGAEYRLKLDEAQDTLAASVYADDIAIVSLQSSTQA